jgi:four helix bundle protein
MNNFRELVVWQKAVDLAVNIYEVTNHFPESERFNLTSQMQRSAVSIASNIAEGAGRNSGALFKQFLSIGLGSCYELETQLVISNKLNYLNEEKCRVLVSSAMEIQKMIAGLRNTL